jgi:hypothetical protein
MAFDEDDRRASSLYRTSSAPCARTNSLHERMANAARPGWITREALQTLAGGTADGMAAPANDRMFRDNEDVIQKIAHDKYLRRNVDEDGSVHMGTDDLPAMA